MRVAFFTIGFREPAARFRVMPYIPLLEKAGWRCMVWHKWPSYGSRLYAEGRCLTSRVAQILGMCVTLPRVLSSGRFDLVFLQRRLPGLLWPPLLERLLRKNSRRMVFDLDDAIYIGARADSSFREIVNFSDHIIAGNADLAIVVNSPSKATVIPTPVDTDRFRASSLITSSQRSSLNIGWTGTAPNYRYLYPLAPTLRKVAERFPNAILKVICDKPPDLRLLPGLRVQFVPWQAEKEVEQLYDIDIGIMYLPDTPWARGKCGFKLIQYMSLAKPVVASPVGVNVDIVNHGVNGYLARTMDEWYEYISFLLADAAHRDNLGNEARQTIDKGFSLRACFPKFLSVFQQAID